MTKTAGTKYWELGTHRFTRSSEKFKVEIYPHRHNVSGKTGIPGLIAVNIFHIDSDGYFYKVATIDSSPQRDGLLGLPREKWIYDAIDNYLQSTRGPKKKIPKS